MEKLFETPKAGDAERQRKLTSGPSSEPGAALAATGAEYTSQRSNAGASGQENTSDLLTAPATVWTSGFEEDYERPSTPLKVLGVHKYADPSDDPNSRKFYFYLILCFLFDSLS